MVHEMIDGTYRQTNLPNESPEYLAKREELRLAEIELLNTRERGGSEIFKRTLVAINISLLWSENKFNCCTSKLNSSTLVVWISVILES